MSEEKASYPRTLTSFSGADCVCIINGKMMGEFQEIQFEHNYDAQELPWLTKGYLDVAVFDREPIIKEAADEAFATGSDMEFALYFASEYGQYMKMEFPMFQVTKQECGVSIDDIVQVDRYYFRALNVHRRPGIKYNDFETKEKLTHE